MRHFSYNVYCDNDEEIVVTVSEEEIRKHYWSHWYKQMSMMYERSYVDENFNFEDCLEEWRLIYCARRVDDEE